MIFVDVGLDAIEEKVVAMETLLVSPVQMST
jgi:hypothetical protein